MRRDEMRWNPNENEKENEKGQRAARRRKRATIERTNDRARAGNVKARLLARRADEMARPVSGQ